MSENEALDIISQMVLDKLQERPMLSVKWGKFLVMFLECYPELSTESADGRLR